MSTVTKKDVKRAMVGIGAAYGNAWRHVYSFVTNSSGVMTDSDQTTAVANGDKVRVGILPAGLELMDSLAIVSDAFAGSTTANIGFEYVDGVDDSDVAQDADYFNAALATSSAGRTRAANTAVKPVVLPKDAYLILTVGGADHSAAGRLDILVEGVWRGV